MTVCGEYYLYYDIIHIKYTKLFDNFYKFSVYKLLYK